MSPLHIRCTNKHVCLHQDIYQNYQNRKPPDHSPYKPHEATETPPNQDYRCLSPFLTGAPSAQRIYALGLRIVFIEKDVACSDTELEFICGEPPSLASSSAQLILKSQTLSRSTSTILASSITHVHTHECCFDHVCARRRPRREREREAVRSARHRHSAGPEYGAAKSQG